MPDVAYALRLSLPPGDVTGIAVLLHGGRERSTAPVRGNQLAVLRMLPIARALTVAGRRHGLAVARVRNGVRGWNGEQRAPVADARAALDRLAERFPDVPVTVIGHSMGGRTALYVAGHQQVRAVVALAPWIEPGDPVDALRGRRVLILHGPGDRITSADASAAYARSAAAVAQSVSFVRVTGDGHAMLRRAGVWHRMTTGYVLGVFYGAHVTDATRAPVLAQALAGEPALVV